MSYLFLINKVTQKMVRKRYNITINDDTTDIGTAAELVVALDVLQGHHDRIVLQQLRPHITQIIRAPQDLYSTLKVLIPEDQIFLIESIGNKLVDIIEAANHLRDIFATLSDYKVEEKIIQTLGTSGLKTLIHSAEELSEILEWVYGNCDKMVLELLGVDYLKHLIQNGYELSLVLHSLDHKCQEELIDMISWTNVMQLIKDRRDLAHILRALPEESSKRLLKEFTKDQLWKIIRDDFGWKYLYKYLEDEEAAYLKKILGVKNAK